jgi:hypothetical protein
VNIIDDSDEEILEVAHPMWDDLIKYSNKGQYGKFIRKFSYELLLGLNQEKRAGAQAVQGTGLSRHHPPR